MAAGIASNHLVTLNWISRREWIQILHDVIQVKKQINKTNYKCHYHHIYLTFNIIPYIVFHFFSLLVCLPSQDECFYAPFMNPFHFLRLLCCPVLF